VPRSPAASTISSVTRWQVSVPRFFSIDTSKPKLPPVRMICAKRS
jgi:hypothetical protein